MKSSLVGLLVVWAASAGVARAAAPDPAWYSIVTDKGAAIGYASRETTDGPDGREITESQTIAVMAEGTPSTVAINQSAYATLLVWRTVRKEDKAGRTVSIEATTQSGRNWSRNTARIEDGTARIVHETPFETRSMAVALPANVRFDDGDGLLPGWNPAERLEFDNFNIDAMAVEHVVIAALPGAKDETDTIAALRERFDGSQLLAVSRLTIDRAGRIVEAGEPMAGAGMVIRATDRQTALSSYVPYRALPAVMTKSPYLISGSAMHGHIRYRFAFQDGLDFALPQTSEQRVTAGPGTATVDICEICGPGMPTDKAYLADALKPTAWLQSDNPKLIAVAKPIAALLVSDTRKMELLLDKGRPYLRTIDFNGHYSALETMERRTGDCTEAAVLLAAFGRAAGIPTRVANGLVYSRESYHGVANVFMPHSWTLAYVDGHWKSFDLALDAFDSTHIALTVGDGDARSVAAGTQLAGLLHWDEMAEVRAPPEK